ncbi:hypothetical protein [Clostridium sporogenes]|uniref:hypothetical protein n=1 Tax=Clostridium sporogenes TaxID=1509 RepID=UPI0013D8C09A|nr:hypothetical protein [Clostridium sporogenes]NFH40827.1 hypothetical protein [Clostridium sporogenes]
MARKCKCKYCKKEINTNIALTLTDDTSKKPKKLKMCSQECIEKYKEDLKRKIEENKSREELYKFIMNLHGKTYLPNYFYILISDLINGTVRQKGLLIDKKLQKEGVSWKDILDGYRYSEEMIKKTLDRKSFDGYINELKYCFAIVKNNIPKAKEHFKIKKEIIEETNINIPIENNFNYKKKKFNNDISDIL